MKILYICNASGFLGPGGMEYHLMDVTAWLERQGVEIALAVRKGTHFEQEMLKGRAHVYPLSWTGIGKICSFFQLIRAIRDFSPDIVSVNRERDIVRVYYLTRVAGFFLRKRPKIAAVFHNLGWTNSFEPAKLDGIIFPNDSVKQDFISRNGDREFASVIIYHGVPLPDVDLAEKADPNRIRRYFTGGTFPLIGMVGEMRKNQTELIDVAAALKNKLQRFTFAFVGRGSAEDIATLQEKIDRMGLTDHFIFTGRVERERMADLYHDLDLSVTTFRKDAFGMVYIESLAAGTPLVAYNAGGPVEILAKGGGVLVDGGPEDMAEALYRLIVDAEARSELGVSGREAVKAHFTVDAMGAGHYAFYQNLLSARSGTSSDKR